MEVLRNYDRNFHAQLGLKFYEDVYIQAVDENSL
jgi:hypothetical protein